jgi:WD40 repeat protein
VWRRETGELVASLAVEGPVEAARFSPDERWLATFGSDLEATAFWDVQTGARVWEIPMASNDSAGVVFGPEGHTLVIGGVDGSLGWWDLERRAESYSIALGDFVIGIAASADRERIVTNAGDLARAWDVRTGQELRQMPYAGWLTAVAISADGRYLASAGRDTESSTAIEVTEIWPEDPVAAACKKVQRNLTRSEWRQYIGDSEPYQPSCPGIGDGQERE